MKYFTIGMKTLPGQSLWKISILICVLGTSCKNTLNKEPAYKNGIKDIPVNDHFNELPSDFLSFYEAFHSDSTFQMNHIVFPLKGLPDQADPEDLADGDFYFTSDQWVIQNKIDPKRYEVEYINIANILIEERIRDKEHNLFVIRRFAKKSEGWELIYYAGLNKYKTPN